MEFGDVMNKRPDSLGGSNLTLDFIKEIQINTGGYSAESAAPWCVVTSSRSQDQRLHGSAFMYWSPYFFSADTKVVLKTKSALVGG